MKYKRWSLEQKLEILSVSEDIGIVESYRKYGVSTGTFYSWKKKFEHQGEAGLKVTYDARSKELKEAEEENVKSWVYAIAKNSIIDYYRKKKHFSEEVEDIFIQEELSIENAVNELSHCIIPFINQLPKDYISIMKLSEIKNLSQKEIAENLDLNYTTVRSKIQRGRVKLKELISNCCTVIQGGKGGIIDFKKNGNCNKNC